MTTSSPATKRCSCCGAIKNIDEFYPHNRDGRRSTCKACQRRDVDARRHAAQIVAARHAEEYRAEVRSLLTRTDAA